MIVTFTNAAATEMRERLLEEIYKKLDCEPNNAFLQKQIILLNKANISTIHSFCLDVIKNNFYIADISANSRLASIPEVELLKMEVLEELFEKLYEKNDESFIKLINIYSGYRDDDNFKDIILKIYNFIQSTPFPEDWIKEQVEKFNLKNKIDEDFSKTEWGKILIDDFRSELLMSINRLKSLSNILKKDESLNKFYFCILEDIKCFEELLTANNWNEIYQKLLVFKLKTWPTDKNAISEEKEHAKKIRDQVKKEINSYKEKVFFYNSKSANEDIYAMYDILNGITKIVCMFMEQYNKTKKERNLIDFNDIEHIALNILIKKQDDGIYTPSDVAKKYQEKFNEIAIDEYQDSNLVQEFILNSVSRNNNMFMVGDVKQSIYKFRQARPELFLEKYENYSDVNEKTDNGRKIKLYENFRSRESIINLTNSVFQSIMSKDFGDIEYNEEEFLNQGLEFEKTDLKTVGKPELHIIDLHEEDDEDEYNNDEDSSCDEILDNIELEAKFVAKRVKEILESTTSIWDKKTGYRKPTFKDIAILLRTTTGVANIYEREITNLGYPVFCDTSTNYFESIEIQTIMNLLKVIDNPMLDIPLVSVLRSPIVGMTDNELVKVRVEDKNVSFFEALNTAKNEANDTILKEKVEIFLNLLKDFQEKQEYLKLDELIWDIYEKTGYYNYISLMTDGNIRTANLRMLFEKAKEYEESSFKGLYNFINFIDKVTKSGSDMGAPKLIGENENVIRIMSIHKSKGLEFPIVFLCGTGKQFNTQDLNESIILHQDMGFGPKYINYERKIEYNTLAKEAIKIKTKKELKSEEMRLLYVALTRAREKIIITGISKDIQKSLKQKEELLNSYNDDEKINSVVSSKAKSYLDWLELIILKNKDLNKLLKITYHKKNEIQNTEVKNNSNKKIDFPDEEKPQNIDVINKLTWTYPNSILTSIEGKSSVSKIANKEEIPNKIEQVLPNFLKDIQTNISGAEKGTVMHLILQKMNFKEEYTIERISDLLEELEEKKIINAAQKESVEKEKILNFTKSDLFKQLKKAKNIYKEKAFYINIPAKEIYNNDIEEPVLVQGIIDLYFIDENDNMVLVDYKTDYVPNNDEEYLRKKYEKQLQIYAKAIEEASKKRVDKIYIYPLYLNKEIIIFKKN